MKIFFDLNDVQKDDEFHFVDGHGKYDMEMLFFFIALRGRYLEFFLDE